MVFSYVHFQRDPPWQGFTASNSPRFESSRYVANGWRANVRTFRAYPNIIYAFPLE